MIAGILGGCRCGGTVTITSNPFTGATRERCAKCGYDGVPRPPAEDPLSFTPRGMKAQRTTKQSLKKTGTCKRCETRRARCPGARYCRPCDRELKAEQSLAAKLRHQRRKLQIEAQKAS